MDRRAKLGLAFLLVFCVFVLLAVTSIPRTHSGSLFLVASTEVPRFAHTATLLKNGRVLIAGGMARNGEWLDTAELYDPEHERFTPTGVMLARRAGATATLLPNGKVLIAGGNDGESSLATAELYDSTTNRFFPAGKMTSSRGHAQAVTLSNGKVLIIGGNAEGDSQQLTSAELYDPATNKFTSTGSMQHPRSYFTSVRLHDGRVLVAGGMSGGHYPDQRIEATAEIYDPSTAHFSPAGNMAVPRYKLGSVLLQDGRVLIAGGSDSHDWRSMYASTEIFDPQSGTFNRGPQMKNRRFKLAQGILSLPDGRVLIAGGASELEMYDPSMRRGIEIAAASLDGFFYSTTTLLEDGRVLIVGGYGTNPQAGAVRHAWIWKP
ncbi:MAG TPA: kelch repeat-containing protein [Candidatus Limnocylindrales bacterium]|jgi:hypothetical protein|nr:kelch repeat-containing protein [Candidatus Limnocylindrales bacterium]